MMLKEVFLFARPEEKHAIERALISVIGPMYTAMPALGRGSKGGVEYRLTSGSPLARLFARPALASFLPKIAYYLVLDEEDVDYVLSAVRGTLASEGGPDDCGRGLAIVCPLHEQHSIDQVVQGHVDATEDIAISSEKAQTT